MHNVLRISVVGDVDIRAAGEPVLAGKRKALALLTYLALAAPHRFPRSVVAGLLWENVPEAAARNSLRQILSDLRKAFTGPAEALVSIDRESLGLDTAGVEVDAVALMEELAAGRLPDVLIANPELPDLLFRGLDGIGDEFDAWLHEMRRVFEEQLTERLGRLIEPGSAPEETRLKAAGILLRLDPFNEKACREVMAISAARGETREALKAYEALFMRLEEEMDIEPSPQTQDLAVRIKMGEFKADPPAQPAARPAAVATEIGPPRLAVFPFQNLGPDDVPDYFVDGILEDTVCMLASLKEPRVLSSNSTRGANLRERSARERARELGANYTVFGSIRRAHQRYHISVQLVEVGTELVEWARTYTASENELFDIQSHIAGSIANKLQPSVQTAELRRTSGFKPADLSAYHLTLRAKELAFRLKRESFGEARDLLLMAAEKDPTFAPTFIALTDWYSISLGQGWSDDPGRDWKALEDAASRALRLSGESGRALAMYAHNQTIQHGADARTESMLSNALEQTPSDAEALVWSVPTLAFLGKADAAVENGERAASLSPSDPFMFRYQHFLSIAYFAQRDYGKAAEIGVTSAEANPMYASNVRMTAAAFAASGNMPEARRFAEMAMEIDPGYSLSRYEKTQPFKDPETATALLENLRKAGLPR
ncbi:Bacterial transcriptional activator domain protein [Pseudoruegeria aquimaris]|uniref:Bacterial transcriptional activator domain protein n=1 Tax=Pseudoruegeria aquimaris TaxID=393663 RepID=A0A1Y5TSY1_9RHOB|nr:BTAD domain-containing putative transcriptional regulator [Pseudoruegeria aquimaris]SLN69470.1 Bacterial transcriptional activator domain protein [Pseudoruegeria aquimaris]